jgi:NADPH:quinone reductase-like Zn-dependent oxidoreductase
MNTGDYKDTSSKLMKRVVYNRFGGPDVLEIQDTPIPQANKGEVLVRMLATSINGGDLNVRKGAGGKIAHSLSKFPKTTGQDVVGIVEKLGPGVTDLNVGDRVWGNTTTSTNAAAEYVVISANKLSLMPSKLSVTEAAGIPCAGDTAFIALVEKGQIKAGDRVLIRGAGGVGIFAVQIAKALGAHVSVVASRATMDAVMNYGADEVYDYRETSLEELKSYDIIFDTVGTDLDAFRKKLTPKGKLLTIAFDVENPIRGIMRVLLSARHGQHRTHLVIAFPNRKNLTQLAQMVSNGDIVPIIDSIYPMEQIVEAHRRAENRGILGKIIISISQA